MQKASIYLSMSVFLLVISLAWSPGPKKQFWKGNMHTHSFWSDGNTFPEEVAYWFKKNGYNFLLVTDHNILQEGEKWINADRNKSIRETYDKYLEHFGGVGLDTKTENDQLHVRLRTLKEYRSEFEVPGEFLLLSGEEISDASEKKPVHLNGVDISTLVHPAGGETVKECLRNNVLAIEKALAKDGHPNWIIVNHPNFGWAMTAEDIAASGAWFFEVYNGHPSVNNYGNEDNPGTEEIWDQVNKIRAEKGQDLLYGVANDDVHHYHEFRIGRANPGRGWSMIRAESLDSESLYKSMMEGDYYFSTGVELKDFNVSSRKYVVSLIPAPEVEYKIEFIGLLKGEENAKTLATVNGAKARYKFSGDEIFVRARITSTRKKENPYAEGDVEMAWLQPVRPK
ncbi:MAG: histidinol-phosphatase [Bacteroidetes bacterium]|jgi:hypothetical protein|nr:histidinol-phosphatase [Bacteroidota bacterium]MBT3750486.1 histidinol-phosphatase [Bacteroidota bacterium]MBT4400203.1 histidinol-phosphatase [Bacteroidota bacterium]MBT4411789.1 histidinol-phosphatase [Bacteroidota bacterium]MBT7094926.1 histidinol-phosphatase [Bacteroidota bacterium]